MRPGPEPGLKRGLIHAAPRALLAWLIIAAIAYELIRLL